MKITMSKGVTIERYYQAINPNCQFQVMEYVGFYNNRHYYNVQLLDNGKTIPLTQHQILSGNFIVPNAKKIKAIYKGIKK